MSIILRSSFHLNWLSLQHILLVQRIACVNTLFHFTQTFKPCGKTILCPLFDLTFHFIIFCHWVGCIVMAAWHRGVILAQSGPRVHQWPKLKAEQPLRSRLWCNESHLPHIAALEATVGQFQGNAALSQTPNMSFKFWRWNQIGQKLKSTANACNLAGPNWQIHLKKILWYLFSVSLPQNDTLLLFW